MKREDNILNELREQNSIHLINGIECPFQIDPNYFSNFSKEVWKIIGVIDCHIDPVIEITETLTKAESWDVPDQYFTNLPEILLQKVKMQGESEDEHSTIPPTSLPYMVDENYFNQNLQNLVDQVKFQVEPKLSTTLESLRTRNTYLVANNYFNSLAKDTLKSIQHTEDTIDNTITFQPKRKKAKTWLVAASVILLASFGVNRFLDMETEIQNPEQKKNTLLASIPNSSIDEYINYNLDEFEMTAINFNTIPNHLLNNIPNTEIDAYLELMN